MPLTTLISGGQTGVDRAALDAALKAGFPCGGWCPAERLAEDGPIPLRYPLVEMEEANVLARTHRNVEASDGTLILHCGPLRGGTEQTVLHCVRVGKPHRLIDAEFVPLAAALQAALDFISQHRIATLNVAGPRASEWSSGYAYAAALVGALLAAPQTAMESSPVGAAYRSHSAGPRAAAMKLGYTILYVPDVAASLEFYGRAFALPTRFLHDSGTYGELDTGSTTLAFAAHALGEANLPGGHVRASESPQPLGMEIALVTDDVPAAHGRALAEGATELAPPTPKPWGQVVSYLRAPDGCLIELCTPVAGTP